MSHYVMINLLPSKVILEATIVVSIGRSSQSIFITSCRSNGESSLNSAFMNYYFSAISFPHRMIARHAEGRVYSLWSVVCVWDCKNPMRTWGSVFFALEDMSRIYLTFYFYLCSVETMKPIESSLNFHGKKTRRPWTPPHLRIAPLNLDACFCCAQGGFPGAYAC